MINFLKSQASLDFTGRITIINKEKSFVFMQKGEIIQAYYGRIEGEKALFRIICESNESTSISSEYENIAPVKIRIRKQFDELIGKIEKEINEYNSIIEFFPKKMPELKPNPDFIKQTSRLTESQFKTLYSVIKYKYFADILDFTPQDDIDILKNLISLKKNSAIL